MLLRSVICRAHTRRGSYSGCQRLNSVSPPTKWVPPAVIMRLQATDWPFSVLAGLGSTLPGASMLSPAFSVPASSAWPRSVRSDCASRTAASTFSAPVPCSSKLALASGWALYCRMAFTSGGVSPGLACSIKATAPATAGAATEVPLSSIKALCGLWLAPATWLSWG